MNLPAMMTGAFAYAHSQFIDSSIAKILPSLLSDDVEAYSQTPFMIFLKTAFELEANSGSSVTRLRKIVQMNKGASCEIEIRNLV